MQNLKKYVIPVLFSISLVCIICYKYTSSIDYFKKKVDSYLSLSDWSFEVGSISGSLFGNIKLENATLQDNDNRKVIFETLEINIGLFDSFFKKPTLDILSINNVTIDFNKSSNKVSSLGEFNDSFLKDIMIRKILIDGYSKFNIDGYKMKTELLFEGALNYKNKNSLFIKRIQIVEENNPELILEFNDLNLDYDSTNYSLRNLRGRFGKNLVKGDVYFQKSSSFLSGNLNIDNIKISDELFRKTPLKNKFSEFNGIFDFQTDLKNFNGQLILENNLGLDMKGEFSLKKLTNSWNLENLRLSSEKSELILNGTWEKNDHLNFYVNLEKLDLSSWILDQKPTEMSGLIIIDGGLTKSGSLDQINLTLEMEELLLFDQGEISIHGQLLYSDSTLSTTDQVLLMINDNYLSLDGKINFKTNYIDILTDLEKAEIQLINSFLVGDFVSGLATGKLTIRGDLKNPSANADLVCENIIINDFHVKSIDFNSRIEANGNSTIGYIDLKAEEGNWKDMNFENGMISASIQNDQITVENFNFKSGKDFLQFTGSYNGGNNYLIDRLQLAYRNNYLVNTTPILFFYSDSNLNIDPFELHINDGVLEGYVYGKDNPEGQFKMSNFDAEILTSFFNDNKFMVSGLIFGEVWIKPFEKRLDLDIDVSLKNGKYMNESFDEMIISLLYKNDILHIDDISMTKEGSMGIQINGIVPNKNNNNSPQSIIIESNFSNLSLEFIHRFIPDFFKIDGEATGFLKIGGTVKKTTFKYDLNIKDGIFDAIPLGNINSTGKYNGNYLLVDKVVSLNKNNKIFGIGRVPFDFNISSNDLGAFFKNDSINFLVEGNLAKLSFLSPYIEDLDSLTGDINISLNLKGPMSNMLKSGSISIANGSAYTLLLNEPIINIQGIAQMGRNNLVIEKLVGGIYNNENSSLLKENTNIKGAIDLTQFFNPSYDLSIKSNNASFKTLYLDISGQSNLDLKVTGKDTINISGEIETSDLSIFYEFTKEEFGTAISEEIGTVLSYKLVIPIRGNSYFQNSQVDAKIFGELSLSKMGNQEIDFGGQIYIENGSVFSYKDNFNDLQGIINFDNKGFNPYIDANAYTMIDDERIDLRVMGEIEDLDIILESESGFSESDILELLAWGKRIEDQEWTSVGFGSQTVSFLGSLLENQLEKNLKESNTGVMNYVDDINISGAMGLIQGNNEDFELTAMRQIGDKTFLNLSYKRSFSLNQSAIGVEYKLNKHFSVVGNIDESGKLNLKYRYRYAY